MPGNDRNQFHSGEVTYLENKPYAFVPFAQTRPSARQGHEKYLPQKQGQSYLTGSLSYQLTADSPLHIGTGIYGLFSRGGNSKDQEVVKTFTHSMGKLVIPGTSVKGCLRSIAEAISNSCRRHAKVDDGGERGECDGEQVCPTCSMFGYLGYRGKVAFYDAVVIGGGDQMAVFYTAALNQPHPENRRIYYTENGGQFGRKFYFHAKPADDPEHGEALMVVKAGTSFAGRITFENLSQAEMDLLLFAMGLDGTFQPKLGGGKPRGLGSVKLEIAEIILYDPSTRYKERTATEKKLSGSQLDEFIRTAVHRYSQRDDLKAQIAKLRSILHPDFNRQSPSAVY